jgi:SAM-dependent methyltransferase
LLNSVNPKYGLGLENNSQAAEMARQKFPHLEFWVQEADSFYCDRQFDYIILPQTISYLDNIQKTLFNLKKVCKPSTKFIVIFHNPGWELILKLATFIKQRMPIDNLNWLSYEDIKNLLELEDYEVISHRKRMLFPRRVPLLFWLFNKILAPLPLLNNLCLSEYIVARSQPNIVQGQENIRQLSCSVIVPARNEAGNIESCVTRMPKLGKHTEIIFIEGHSSDWRYFHHSRL